MALVKNPAGGIAASGKIGGTVFARNRAGQYARAWAKPVNPGSARQSLVRSQFGASTTGWGSITESEREAWNAYAATMTRLNRLGEPYTPKGRQIYMESSQNMKQSIETPLSVPGPTNETPGIVDVGPYTAVETAGVLTELEIATLAIDIPSGGDGVLIVEAAPIHEPKLSNVNNQFRQIGAFDPTAAPIDLLAAYIATFTNVAVAGNIASIRIRLVDKLTGLSSAWVLLDQTVT